METTDYLTLHREGVMDYGEAFAKGDVKEALAILNRLQEMLKEREDYHLREADLSSAKAYDAGVDCVRPFEERI